MGDVPFEDELETLVGNQFFPKHVAFFNCPSNTTFYSNSGWGAWEEINLGGPGANFGWPYFEGGDTGSLQQPTYAQLTEAQAFYNSGAEVTAPLVSLNHAATGINAIVLGDVYYGDTYPTEYYGDLFFNDLGQGVVRNVSFDANGNVENVEIFTTNADIVVMIQQGPDGNLYYVDLDDGNIGRWVFA